MTHKRWRKSKRWLDRFRRESHCSVFQYVCIKRGSPGRKRGKWKQSWYNERGLWWWLKRLFKFKQQSILQWLMRLTWREGRETWCIHNVGRWRNRMDKIGVTRWDRRQVCFVLKKKSWKEVTIKFMLSVSCWWKLHSIMSQHWFFSYPMCAA